MNKNNIEEALLDLFRKREIKEDHPGYETIIRFIIDFRESALAAGNMEAVLHINKGLQDLGMEIEEYKQIKLSSKSASTPQ